MVIFIAFIVAIVFDIIIGVITYSALSITSMSDDATMILTITVYSVFLIAEFVAIFIFGSKRY